MSNKDTVSLVPNHRFPEFIGDGPWRLCETRDFLNESRNPSEENDPSRRITVRLNLRGVEHREHRGTESTEATNHFRRNAGQFIYGKQNIHKGAFGIIPEQLHGFETSQDLPCFDFKGRCSPQWLFYHFAREDIYLPLELKMTGTGSKRLNEKIFLSLAIPAPSYIEQQKIADCLSSVDELIAAQARKVDALKIHKKGLMQQLLPREGETQPCLRFPEFRDAGEWKILPLAALAEKIMVGIASAATHAYRETGVPMLRNQNIKEGKIDDSSLLFIDPIYEAAHKGKRLRAGDVITVRTGYPGLSAVVTERYQDAQCFTSLITRPKRNVLDPDYLCAFINSEIGKRFILGAEAGGAQKNVNAGALEALSVYLPELEEQRRIAACLSSLDALITSAVQELEVLKTHKKGLMQQLFPSAEAVEA